MSLVVVLSLLLSGCATIVSDSTYPVEFKSDPPGALVKITDWRGREVFADHTPATARLEAGASYFKRAKYKVQCGFWDLPVQTTHVEFKIDPWYFGNFIVGGGLGLLFIDPLTGAMFKPVRPSLFFQFDKSEEIPSRGSKE